jgi:monoamine oxidase
LGVQEDSVEVSWLENGQLQTRSCDYVLCTIPFFILKKIELSGFDEQKLASIHNTVYCPATKVGFHCAEPFWEKEGIRGGASFSGEGIRQTYYPSVKFNPAKGSALLASYTIGDDAEPLDIMSDEQRCSYVKDRSSHIHPEINAPGMVVDAATMAWGNYKWGGGGCSIPWGGDLSGEVDHHLNYLEAARPQNRLFFAGEHCSRFPAWLQGSIESALASIYEIVSHQPAVQTNAAPLMLLGSAASQACHQARPGQPYQVLPHPTFRGVACDREAKGRSKSERHAKSGAKPSIGEIRSSASGYQRLKSGGDAPNVA